MNDMNTNLIVKANGTHLLFDSLDELDEFIETLLLGREAFAKQIRSHSGNNAFSFEIIDDDSSASVDDGKWREEKDISLIDRIIQISRQIQELSDSCVETIIDKSNRRIRPDE